MDAIQIIALTMGVAWASGINLYATVFMLGLLGRMGHIVLPPGLEVVMDPLVMFAAGLMYCIEFFADKTPGVDSGWDTIHTFIRIPAGAVLAMGAVGETSQAAQLMAFLLGGGMAAGAHATKAGARVLINTSPEPFSNWATSLGEDVLVIGGLWAALFHPIVFLVGLVIFVALMIWLLPKIWRGLRALFAKIRHLFRKPEPSLPPPEDGGKPEADKNPTT